MCDKCSEIGVMLGDDGATVPLSRGGTAVVFSMDKGNWVKAREMPFNVDPEQGLGAMRMRSSELIRFLGNSRTFVASSATGALFFDLEKAGFSIWEISGEPPSFLDQVRCEDEAERETAEPAVLEMPVPIQRSPGQYFISIKEVQGKRPDLSSKRILQSFIRKGDFEVLEIVCDHVPPWIETESKTVGFRMEAERQDRNEVLLRLIKVTP